MRSRAAFNRNRNEKYAELRGVRDSVSQPIELVGLNRLNQLLGLFLSR